MRNLMFAVVILPLVFSGVGEAQKLPPDAGKVGSNTGFTVDAASSEP